MCDRRAPNNQRFCGTACLMAHWAYTGNRISVRFEYEWRDVETGRWYRTHGNEHWEFDDNGLMSRRDMSANDIPIKEFERQYRS